MPSTEPLRVISWNVNGIRARWPRLTEMLATERPDVVCLQETRCPEHRFPSGRLNQLGYRSQHSPGRRRGGVAILVRSDHRVTHRSSALDHHHDLAEGRWLEVTIEGLTIGCVYVPAGHTREEVDDTGKLAFLEAMAREVHEQHNHPLLLAGDFNIAPTDQDVYEPSWFDGSYLAGEAERSDLREILHEGELIDVYRQLHPDDRGFTCWDQRDGHYARDYGLRIDLILASQGLASHVTRCDVAHTYRQGHRPSNHAPLQIELNDVEQCGWVGTQALDATTAAGAGD
ncbi:MAG: exodeoxyribonuclease III [Solirubrobacterales bacterium]